jgi:hypothetical protein
LRESIIKKISDIFKIISIAFGVILILWGLLPSSIMVKIIGSWTYPLLIADWWKLIVIGCLYFIPNSKIRISNMFVPFYLIFTIIPAIWYFIAVCLILYVDLFYGAERTIPIFEVIKICIVPFLFMFAPLSLILAIISKPRKSIVR